MRTIAEEEAPLGEIIRSAVEHMGSYKPTFSRDRLAKLFVVGLLIALAYFLLAERNPQTLSIIIKPCGDTTTGI